MDSTTPDLSTPSAGWDKGERLWQRGWVRWLIIFGVWTGMAFLFTNQLYYTRLLSERPITWGDAASSQFIYPYLWAFGTILIFWLAERYPLDRQKIPRNVLLHLLWATLFVIALNGLFHIILHFMFLDGPKRPYMVRDTVQTIIYNSTEAYGIYALLLLLHQGFRYYRRFREGELRASQLEAQLSQAQLQALKMQLHPHFLFNTLHSISALVHKDPECADRMIARLGDFLRLTLENSGAHEVSLQKELEFLGCYLEIERVRFQDRLTTHMEIESQALDTPVPNLILNPSSRTRSATASPRVPVRAASKFQRNEKRIAPIEVQDNGPASRPSQSNGRFREGLGSRTHEPASVSFTARRTGSSSDAPGGGLLVTLEIPATRASTS